MNFSISNIMSSFYNMCRACSCSLYPWMCVYSWYSGYENRIGSCISNDKLLLNQKLIHWRHYNLFFSFRLLSSLEMEAKSAATVFIRLLNQKLIHLKHFDLSIFHFFFSSFPLDEGRIRTDAAKGEVWQPGNWTQDSLSRWNGRVLQTVPRWPQGNTSRVQ